MVKKLTAFGTVSFFISAALKNSLAVTGSLTAVFAYGLFMRYSALYRHSEAKASCT